jgi:molybdopterin biosynthesis enzyme
LLPLQEGEAVRIGTGAPIPTGADAVVQVEDTTVLKKDAGDEIEISINKKPVKGQDIRLRETVNLRQMLYCTFEILDDWEVMCPKIQRFF